MKPKDAARIFEQLDMETLLLVAEPMKERKLAPIMAQMNPTKAMEITVELARLRQVAPASAPLGGPSGRG
jgi:flagellar motility protein MotE (MotC chaperone)